MREIAMVVPNVVTYKQFQRIFLRIYPKPSFDHFKGCLGKICVIGGSDLYTGAPYFSAISALKLGADLVYVICPKEASTVIKSYSPELMVMPYLDNKDRTAEVDLLVEKCNSVIIGPGLGRALVSGVITNIKSAISKCIKEEKHLILDADALWLLVSDRCIMQTLEENINVKRVILTPNRTEYLRMLRHFSLDGDEVYNLSQLAKVTKTSILLKGHHDLFSDGNEVYDITAISEMCPKRCGGQGDVLAGILSVCLFWARTDVSTLEASIAASNFTKLLARHGFDTLGVSMTATDMIYNIPYTAKDLVLNIEKKNP